MSKPSLNVLLVEDNPDHADLFIYSLEDVDRPINITHKDDGDICLSYLKELAATQSTLPNLIILDIKMPRLDGMGVLRVLKATPQLNAIPVVMVSTSAAESDIQLCLELGAKLFLCKPASTAAISDVLTKLEL